MNLPLPSQGPRGGGSSTLSQPSLHLTLDSQVQQDAFDMPPPPPVRARKAVTAHEDDAAAPAETAEAAAPAPSSPPPKASPQQAAGNSGADAPEAVPPCIHSPSVPQTPDGHRYAGGTASEEGAAEASDEEAGSAISDDEAEADSEADSGSASDTDSSSDSESEDEEESPSGTQVRGLCHNGCHGRGL